MAESKTLWKILGLFDRRFKNDRGRISGGSHCRSMPYIGHRSNAFHTTSAPPRSNTALPSSVTTSLNVSPPPAAACCFRAAVVVSFLLFLILVLFWPSDQRSLRPSRSSFSRFEKQKIQECFFPEFFRGFGRRWKSGRAETRGRRKLGAGGG